MPELNRHMILTADAAELLGCTTGRVRQLVLSGDLRGEHLNPRLMVVDRRSVLRYSKRKLKKARPRKFSPRV